MENENATRILVLRAEEKQEGWLVNKGYEHKQILLEEALNRLRFEYASATKEATTFTAAFDVDALAAFREKFPAWRDADDFRIQM